jgi:acyl-CoA-binding protein
MALSRWLQATEGDNKSDKPGMFSGFEAGYKWQAWEDLKGACVRGA